MIKLCTYPAIGSQGEPLIEMLFDPGQLHHSHLDKVASPYLPEIREYLDTLRPDKNCVYALINALGSYEYWSSNANGDAFEEEHLIHRGPVWGYETFKIYARPYMHHRNKDPNRAFGTVEVSCWNPRMHRVELVAKLDRSLAAVAGAQSVFDKIDHGMLPATSMGTKVPYDLSSITTDWDLYRKALNTFNPNKHAHPGMAVLQYHKNIRKIPGLAITRNDYDEYCTKQMNRILPNGQKVCVFNPYPRFFDISFVFIGAEYTSRMMAKLAQDTNSRHFIVQDRSISLQQPPTHKEFDMVKTASLGSVRSKMARLAEKQAEQRKRAEIIKDVTPSFDTRVFKQLQSQEEDLPTDTLNGLANYPLPKVLGGTSLLGMLLKPKEFQRIVLVRVRRPELADHLDKENATFCPHNCGASDVASGFSSEDLIPEVIQKLLPFVGSRSFFGPVIKRRIISIKIQPSLEREPDALRLLRDDPLMDKVASLYDKYLTTYVEKISHMGNYLTQFPEAHAAICDWSMRDVFEKTAALDPNLLVKGLLTAVPVTYLASKLMKYDAEKKLHRGESPSVVQRLIGDHPHLLAALASVAVLKASGSSLPGTVANAVKNGITNILESKPENLSNVAKNLFR